MAVRALRVHTECSKFLRNWSHDLESLRQNWLLNESGFLTFARDRGLIISGLVKGEPSEFHTRGWLSGDGRQGRNPLFHPFRLHVLHEALSADRHLVQVRPRVWNEIADLAILLEPIYWPEITGQIRSRLG